MTIFFETTAEFRKCMKTNHKKKKPLKVGFRTRPNGHVYMPFEDALAEAVKYGWCSLKKVAIDKTTYAVVFGPRAPNSRWSAEDAALAQALIDAGEMLPSGLKAFENRLIAAAKPESVPSATLPPLMLAELKRHAPAWANFQKLPAAQRQKGAAWVMSAKFEKTRSDRFAKLLMDMSRPRK